MTATVRRSRRDIALARFVRIGQVYRERNTGDLWRVRQVHRADCQLELAPTWTVSGDRICIRFEQLRAGWTWIAGTPRTEAS